MIMDKIEIFKKASLCRNFDEVVFNKLQDKTIQYPTYLSVGQEFIPATIAQYMEETFLDMEPDIFIQHRGHATYLSFGGDVVQLIDELLGRKSGCANGMGGSASIHSKEKNIYGHDGLMGSQVPIAVGSCYASQRPTIVFMGDSSAEEDYVFSSIGWAVTKNLPILFVVEDNNLSILTEKSVRRSWDMHEVARGFGMEAHDLPDNPYEIPMYLKLGVFEKPMLLNINTIRKYWHAGAGIDDVDVFDRYEHEMGQLGDEGKKIHEQNKKLITELWQRQLEKQ
jgi:pyruvate dehydrogenase E1 component alpha subunit|tara:strand:- start:139 stop:981 length:843 start_codon:yes stop_codon:yes gene_type:complete